MTFDEAIKELESAKNIKSSSTLVWCPAYSDSKWDYKAIDYLLKIRKEFDERWPWNKWKPEYVIEDLVLPTKFIKLYYEFCYLETFVKRHCKNHLEDYTKDYYGSFYLGNTEIRVFFRGDP